MKEEIKREYWSNGQIWDDNGEIHYEIPYLNGKEHGLSKVWDDNGQPYWEIPYKNDRQHGAKIEFEY